MAIDACSQKYISGFRLHEPLPKVSDRLLFTTEGCVMDVMSGAPLGQILAHEASSNNSGQQPHCMVHAGDPAFMSQLAFSEACLSLIDRSRDADFIGMELRLVEVFGEAENQYLAITRSLLTDGQPTVNYPFLDDQSQSDVVSDDCGDDDDDDDDAAIHHPKTPSPSIEYNIILSPSYRVPVLYFFLHNLASGCTRDLNAIHRFLVPDHIRPALQQVGVMGGISMSNHPVTGMPAYFIHPCNTAEAMRGIIGGRSVLPQEYLQIWIGLVGSCVGLYLPSQLVVNELQNN